jgi:hypothetical protein
MLQISLSKEPTIMMLFLEDLFPVIPKDLYQERVYRLQLRGSNGFSPFSLLIKARVQPNFNSIEQ